MNIGIVTIAYNNYGRFLPQWCKSISELTIPPNQTTVALGKDHRLTSKMKSECLELLPGLKFVEYTAKPNMGTLRNVAVRNTNTEWIQYLSVDDIILPWAIEEYERYEAEADFIVIRWKSRTMWDNEAPEYEHTPRTPAEMAWGYNGRGFINNQSPYRRWLWKKRPYKRHDYPNAPFVADCVEQGARFVRTERPCTVYLRRLDSHCGLNLGRRKTPDVPGRVVKKEKQQARLHKNQTEQRIRRYYARNPEWTLSTDTEHPGAEKS